LCGRGHDGPQLMRMSLGRRTYITDVSWNGSRSARPKPEHVTCERRNVVDGSPNVRDPIYVIARSGDEVLTYDDVEEHFGTGTLDQDSVLRNWGTWGESLGRSLDHFPEDPSAGAA
jgi:hypothetical protein